jgi:hypothetical protein
MELFQYRKDDGTFDYELYKRVQTEGNHRKIRSQWVDERTIAWLSEFLKTAVSPIEFGLCHGTRQGNEQKWFAKYLGCKVIGTEISDTATSFPNTIQWDFHEVKDEWLGAVDFVYSNSWDHSYDPRRLFTNWMACVRPGGVCLLEHSRQHYSATQLDPFGISPRELIHLLNEIADGSWQHEEILRTAPPVMVNGDNPQKVIYHVLRKN